MVIATLIFCVTAMIILAISVWRGDVLDNPIILVTYLGIKVGKTTFATFVIVTQLLKTGLNEKSNPPAMLGRIE